MCDELRRDGSWSAALAVCTIVRNQKTGVPVKAGVPVVSFSAARLEITAVATGVYITKRGVWVGSGLLSHTVTSAVPSALVGLTAGFGMGPGVPPQI
jgi:hypothetical protein